jgi:hypothetical protein
MKAGCLTIDQVVLEPKHLAALLPSDSIAAEFRTGLAVTVVDRQEVERLLQATLSDWVDFFFVPTPGGRRPRRPAGRGRPARYGRTAPP